MEFRRRDFLKLSVVTAAGVLVLGPPRLESCCLVELVVDTSKGRRSHLFTLPGRHLPGEKTVLRFEPKEELSASGILYHHVCTERYRKQQDFHMINMSAGDTLELTIDWKNEAA